MLYHCFNDDNNFKIICLDYKATTLKKINLIKGMYVNTPEHFDCHKIIMFSVTIWNILQNSSQKAND